MEVTFEKLISYLPEGPWRAVCIMVIFFFFLFVVYKIAEIYGRLASEEKLDKHKKILFIMLRILLGLFALWMLWDSLMTSARKQKNQPEIIIANFIKIIL